MTKIFEIRKKNEGAYFWFVVSIKKLDENTKNIDNHNEKNKNATTIFVENENNMTQLKNQRKSNREKNEINLVINVGKIIMDIIEISLMNISKKKKKNNILKIMLIFI